MSDSENLSGTFGEFSSMLNDSQPDDAPATDDFVEPQDLSDDSTDDSSAAGDSATATDERADEEDDGSLTAAERVAAVFGQETADDEEPVEPEAQDTEGDDTLDVTAMTPEQLRAMAEEYLKLKAEVATKDVDSEQAAFQAEIATLDEQATEAVQERYEVEVIARGDQHYGTLITQAEAGLLQTLRKHGRETQGLHDDELDAFVEAQFNARVDAVRRPILRAQRTWEREKAAEWEPRVTEAITEARKQNPTLRKKFAEFLCEHTPDGAKRAQPLPKGAVDELLKFSNTDDMPIAAQSLEDAITTRTREKRKESQQRRTEAAKARPENTSSTPPAGRVRFTKPAPLKGDFEEFTEMNRRAKSTFSRV